jgi:hypothetical protein
MTAYADRVGKEIGQAKVIDEGPWSDGSTAQDIHNFRRNERGNLDNRFIIMPLVHKATVTGAAEIGIPDCFSQSQGCLAIAYTAMSGEIPEILFLTSEGVFRYAPWLGSSANGALEEQFLFGFTGSEGSVIPQGRVYFPPQWESVGDRIYWTWCDGGGAWVWDGRRIRPFGFTAKPSPPEVSGPAKDSNPNDGGFSVRGRIGTTDGTFTDEDGLVVGGIDDGEWHYYCAFENVDGAFSPTSGRGGMATIRLELASPNADDDDDKTHAEDLARRFRVMGIPAGPLGTAARILLRTRNLRRLPGGDDGTPRFLHRLPSSITDQWIDDIPDGELGAAWEDRETTPGGFYLLRHYSGSLFIARTNAFPSRIWWSEQTALTGPTPESIMAGHWRDVFPNTGPITALFEAQFGDGAVATTLLVMKEQGVHFLAGNYPEWQIGTLHRRAGCAGPGVIAAVPDGSVIWYGARTFWRLTREGAVEDIGFPIRKRLRRVNYAEAKKGSSFVDRRAGEVVFSLPVDDSLDPSFQFVWDFIAQGWRTMDQVTIHAACEIPGEDLVLISGDYDGDQNVYVWDRGNYNIETQVDSTFDGLNQAIYQTGWVAFGDGAARHATYQVDYLVVTAEETFEGVLNVRTFKDWNEQNSTSGVDQVSFTLAHPEDDDVPFWDATLVADQPEDPAILGTDKYRTRRPFTAYVPINIASAESIGIRLTVPAGRVASLVAISAYGSRVSGPGGRAARVAEAR